MFLRKDVVSRIFIYLWFISMFLGFKVGSLAGSKFNYLKLNDQIQASLLTIIFGMFIYFVLKVLIVALLNSLTRKEKRSLKGEVNKNKYSGENKKYWAYCGPYNESDISINAMQNHVRDYHIITDQNKVIEIRGDEYLTLFKNPKSGLYDISEIKFYLFGKNLRTLYIIN